MGLSSSGKTTLNKILGGRLQENVRGTVTYNDIPYNTAINRRSQSMSQNRFAVRKLSRRLGSSSFGFVFTSSGHQNILFPLMWVLNGL
ncbi:hypothetical protein RND71_019319 [Anisodus tanguticus]|uniref:ABC transporter domain-containing protein n=1 Tax=Anisodus tanguticus TaxID=243964 RepID=A0AAE1V9B1_9SOLA|nr:hypothetical protein RND71_019319 [Anisodus tanguticus]